MTRPPMPDTDEMLLQAFVDGEIDAAGSLSFEQRLAAEPALAARCDALRALSRQVRALPLEQAGAGFLARVAPVAAPASRPSWQRLALAACVSALVASGGTFLAMQHGQPDEALASLVSAHMRGLASPAAMDVASSDRHTVKPWFDGRLAFSPVVPDLAADGYPLVGGRVDAVAGQLAATMVYRYQSHTITLTQVRAAGLPVSALGTRERSRDGYNVLAFAAGDLACWVVTDLPLPQARSFVQAWQRRI